MHMYTSTYHPRLLDMYILNYDNDACETTPDHELQNSHVCRHSSMHAHIHTCSDIQIGMLASMRTYKQRSLPLRKRRGRQKKAEREEDYHAHDIVLVLLISTIQYHITLYDT